MTCLACITLCSNLWFLFLVLTDRVIFTSNRVKNIIFIYLFFEKKL